MPQYLCGGQRTTCQSQVTPSITGVPRNETQVIGLSSRCCYPLGHLPDPRQIISARISGTCSGNITLASIDVWSKRSPFFLCGFLAIKVTPFECRAVGNADLQKDTMEVSHHLDTGVTHYFVFFLCIFLLSFLCTHTKLDMHRKTMVFMCMLVFNFILQL